MNQKKYQVGDSLEMSCSACDADTVHTVEAATKLGKISKAACSKCQTTSTFTRASLLRGFDGDPLSGICCLCKNQDSTSTNG